MPCRERVGGVVVGVRAEIVEAERTTSASGDVHIMRIDCRETCSTWQVQGDLGTQHKVDRVWRDERKVCNTDGRMESAEP